MATFDSTKLPLQDILVDIVKGKIQLPDFQRGWVWDDSHIRSLLVNRPGFCRQSRASYFLSNRSPYEQSTLPRRIQGRGGQTNP